MDIRSERELIKEAIQVQDACNLSGVVNSFSRALSRLWTIAREEGGKGTDWINTHRVSRLYADKIQSLAGEISLDDFREVE
jgi:hypothetical protein